MKTIELTVDTFPGKVFTGTVAIDRAEAELFAVSQKRVDVGFSPLKSLLHDAYQRRDQVGLVVFQREEARVVRPPTSSAWPAKASK